MADRAEIMGEIEGLEVHCRASLMTVDARSRWMADWCDDLAQFPADVIRAAFRDYRQSGQTKFPTPGQIIPAIKAKLRKPDDGKVGPQKWARVDEQTYHEMSISDKIRHQRIMAGQAAFRGGPMFKAGSKWGNGKHLTPEDMPDAWRDARRQEATHHAEVKRLSDLIKREDFAA